MKPLKIIVILALLAASDGILSAQPTPSHLLPDAQIRRILLERIEQQQAIGIVVGVIDANGRRVIADGTFDRVAAADRHPVDGDTVFEIGSATKVFTSLLLADSVQRGEVALSDPASKYLPHDVKMPERGDRQITLVDLATHTSGLPLRPANLTPKDVSNPYADYTTEQLYAFLSSYQLTRDIGSKYEYSNLGAGLLGQVLARRTGVDYETLVRTRITSQLGMTSTAIVLSDQLRQRLAPGHNAQGERVSNWDVGTLAGAGALRSTANDLLLFLSATLGYTESPLSAAMKSMLAVRRPTGVPGLDIALGWHIQATAAGREIVWHNGGTGGYRSLLAFDPKERIGVVVLSNMGTDRGVDDIGRHILDPALPLLAAPIEHKQIALAPEILERYVGKYELAPAFVMAVTRESDRLFIQATGQSKLEVFPSSEREFFLKAVDAQITFDVNAEGRVTGLTLHQNGANQRARRMPGQR